MGSGGSVALHYSSFFGRHEHFASLVCRHSFARKIDGESHESRVGRPTQHLEWLRMEIMPHAALKLHVGLKDSMQLFGNAPALGKLAAHSVATRHGLSGLWYSWVTQAMTRQLRWSRNRAMFWRLPRIASFSKKLVGLLLLEVQ